MKIGVWRTVGCPRRRRIHNQAAWSPLNDYLINPPQVGQPTVHFRGTDMTCISRCLALVLLLIAALSLTTNIGRGFSAIAQSGAPPSAPPIEWSGPDTG